MEIEKDEIKTLMNKYKQKLSSEIELDGVDTDNDTMQSLNYKEFKEENMPGHLSLYETWCNNLEKIVKIQPPKDKIGKIQEAIETCHFNITPAGVMSFAIVLPIIYMMIGLTIFGLIPMVLNKDPSLFFISFFSLTGIIAMIPLTTLPLMFATSWRMKASNQMVLCVFYIVTYMRHTSNLENALEFAADHLSPPLSMDIKKIMWNVETEEYDTVKESLDVYLEGWREYNMEFVEAMHLIESSLLEGDDNRRLGMLDKALDVILEETYEKMLHFAHDLKGPITVLLMIGIILPILALVIMPLVVSFMEGVWWYHLGALFNVILPVFTLYFSIKILSTRPTGYGDSDITEMNPELKKYKKVLVKIGKTELRISPIYIALFILVVFLSIGFSPVIIHTIDPTFDLSFDKRNATMLLEYRTSQKESTVYYDEDLDMEVNVPKVKGPYGLGATLLSVFVILGIGLSLGFYYKLGTTNVMEIREKTKKLENEFSSSLFQLGNRMADGIPAEIAFSRVASIMEGTDSANFFKIVDMNIRRLGMSVKNAIFNKSTGALMLYPSNIIESSMKVLTQSMVKGPLVAAQAIINVSQYIKQIHSVNERLRDLLAEVLSSMKAQVNFLAPLIAGIVIGITSMITTIIGKLGKQTAELSSMGEGGGATGLMDLFGDGLPTYFFQIVVGLYVIQVIYVLSLTINGVENGSDNLSKRYILGKNLIYGTTLYAIISFVVILIFNLIAVTVMRNVGT